MFKNVASQKLTVLAFADAGHASLDAGDRVTGDAANITLKIEQDDDGTQSASNDVSPTEVEDGQYRFDLTQAETNGDKLTFYPESSTAGVQVVALPSNVIYTRPPNFPSMGIETDGHVHGDLKEWLGSAPAALADTDKVQVSLQHDGTSLTTNVATILTGSVAQKYSGPLGPGVYFDDGAANTSTTLGTDGTVGNPVSTLAAATTLCTSLGCSRIYISGESTLALTGQTLTDYDIVGTETVDASTVNLGTNASQSTLTRVRIINCTVYGEHDASDRIDLERCLITDAPAAEATYLHVLARECGLLGDITLDTSANNVFERCYSVTSDGSSPVVGATGAAGTVVFHDYSGKITLDNLSASHKAQLDGEIALTFASGNNVNAEILTVGTIPYTDNTAGMSNITEVGRLDRDVINAQADLALSDYDPPTYDELLGFVQLLARSDAAITTDRSTLLNAINANEGSGAGDYAATADSLEAGDADRSTIVSALNIIQNTLGMSLHVTPLIPYSVDLADTATVRIGLMVINALDVLPPTGDITPGTISIDRKSIGGTSWTSVVADAACSELAGLIYYDEVFDSGTGYAEGDTLRITLKGQSVTDTGTGNVYEISDSNGRVFYTSVRQTMRGTDSAYTGTPPTAAAIRAEIDNNSTQLAALTSRITSTLFTGITSLAEWLGLMAGKQTGNSTARTELRATGAGSGSFDETTDSLEARADATDDANVTQIAGNSAAASNLQKSASTIVQGTAQTGTLSTTQMSTDLSEATADHYNGRIIIWTSGALANQATDITDYDGAGLLTFTAVTEAPSNGDTFVLV